MWPKVDREGVCSSLHDYDVTFARRHTLAELVGLLFSIGIQLVLMKCPHLLYQNECEFSVDVGRTHIIVGPVFGGWVIDPESRRLHATTF